MNSFVYKCQGKAHTYNLFQNQKSTHTHTVYGWLKKKRELSEKVLSDYVHVNKVSKKWQLMSYNMMIGYDIYDYFTMIHFRLRQRMTLTTKIWLDCQNLKNFLAWLCPCQQSVKKMTINVIQHDDRLWYLRLFYNGAFSIASKNDLDDQNLLLATVQWMKIIREMSIKRSNTYTGPQKTSP
jgi:hypothetical protein